MRADTDTSELAQWLLEFVVAAINKYDLSASSGSKSFGELYETPQYEALAHHLNRMEAVQVESPYPYGTRGRESADLLITRNGTRLACEYKALYKTWYRKKGRPYPAYLWSPFENPSKDHSAGHDLWKLATLPAPDVTHVGQVLFSSSHQKDDMPSDCEKYARLARIDKGPWHHGYVRWDYAKYPGYELELRVWVSRAAELATWRDSVAHFFSP